MKNLIYHYPGQRYWLRRKDDDIFFLSKTQNSDATKKKD